MSSPRYFSSLMAFVIAFALQVFSASGAPLTISANRTFGPFYTGQNITLTPVTLTATGGTPSYTWNATFRSNSAENLPPNLTLNPTTGVITGIITQNTTFVFAARVTDSTRASFSTATTTSNPPIKITVTQPLRISGPANATVQQNQAIPPLLFQATGGRTSYTYTQSGLPVNLGINATTGVVSGTATAAPGIYPAIITVTDGNAQTANTTCNVTVSAPPALVWIVNPAPPAGKILSSYNATLNAATGGAGNLSYSDISGLPDGLTFNGSTRRISGTPVGTITENTTYSVVLRVTDAAGASANAKLQNSQVQTIPITISPYDLRVSGPASASVQQDSVLTPLLFLASGGRLPYTYTQSGLPVNLGINATTGVVSGTATAAPGIYPAIITVTDGNNKIATTSCNVTIMEKMSISGPSEITAPRFQQIPSNIFSVIGGTANFTWSISPQTLPTTLSFNAIGRNATISGNATATPGIYPVIISVKDAGNFTTSKNCTIKISGTPLTWVTQERLPDGVKGRPYPPLTLNATGGIAPYTFSGNNSTLSAIGLTLTNGVLAGTPNFIGENATFSLSVTDKNPTTVPRAFLFSVYGNLTILPPRDLGSIPFNTTPSNTLTASGGKPPYKWSLVTTGSLQTAVGKLPQGLSINRDTGKLEGNATETGTFFFNVQVTDSANPPQTVSTYIPSNTNPNLFKIVVSSNPPVPMPAQLPIAIIDGDYPNTAGNYSFTFNATGGLEPRNWSTNSTRPGSIDLNPSTGELRGIPLDQGLVYPKDFPLQVKVSGSNSENRTANYTLTVVKRLRLTGPQVISGLRGNPISNTDPFTATGGRVAYTYSFVNRPVALSSIIINPATGAISGPLNAPVGDYAVTIGVTDTSGQTATTPSTISIRPWPTLLIQGPTNLSEYIGNPIPANTFTASGGKSPYVFSNSTALPASLSLNSSTGVISGNLTAAVGDYPVTIKVTDSAPSSQNATTNCIISIKKWPELVIETESNLGIVDTVSQHTLRLRASGGNGNYQWSSSNVSVAIRNGTVMQSVLPAAVGLVLSVNGTTGLLSYKANASCTVGFTLNVTEGRRSGSKDMRVRFRDPNDFYIETPYLCNGYIGDPSYYFPLTSKNGRNPIKWTATGLEPNFSMSDDGVITAKNSPLTGPETLQVTVTARDSSPSPRIDVQTYTLYVTKRPIIENPPQPPVFTVVEPGGVTPTSKILSVDDFDGDGLNDILALAQNGAPILYINQGGWVFRPNNSGLGDRVRPVLVEDFNNDGSPDILSVDNDRNAAIYMNSGGGLFERKELTELTGLLKTGILKEIDPTVDISCSDIDKDGDLDLLFAMRGSSGGAIIAVFNTTDDDVENITSIFSGLSYLVKTSWGYPKFSITDANGDTKPDLVILQAASNNATGNLTAALYLNTGNSTSAYINPTGGNSTAGFTEKPSSGIEGFLASAFVSVDIDSDGDLDLINGSTGSDLLAAAPRIFMNDGNGTYTRYDAPVHGANFAHTGLAVFDADLDGKMDLLWTEVTGTGKIYPRIWKNNVSANGTIDSNSFVDATADQNPNPATYWGISVPVASTSLLQTTGFAADLDGDGIPDLAFASTPAGKQAGDISTQGSFKMYRNNAQRRNERWLNIQLIGAISPFRGTGARVVVQKDADILGNNGTVTTSKPKVAQLLGPDNGNKAKNNLVFGLAKKSAADRVMVYWPSGQVVTSWVNIPSCNPSNKTLRIPESDALPKPSTLIGRVIPWGASPNGDQNSFTANLTNIVAIAAGGNHNLALRRSGQVLAWGANSTALAVPSNLTGVLQIAAGASHSLALSGNGRIVAWGDNSSKQCDVPRSLRMANQIAAGGNFSLAVSSTGGVVVWGGNGSSEIQPPLNKGITGNASVLQVAAGRSHALALKNDGTVVAWGNNSSSQTNVPLVLQAQVSQIAAGGNHSLALTKNGTVVAWGANNSGQCDVPAGLANVTRIAAGGDQSLALRTDGSIISWGKGYQNAFKKPISSSIIDISAGPEHALALQSINADFIPENMVSVAGGTFPANTANITSRYVGQTVGDFRIGKYEVPVSEWVNVRNWARYFGYSVESSGGKGLSDHPAFSLSWYDAIKWCNAKSEINGLIPVYQLNSSTFKGGNPSDPSLITMRPNATGFRLASEKEWEWAARGGNQTNGYRFSGGGNLTQVGWVFDNSLNSSVNLFEGRGTWPIGGKTPNELGLFDMTGNVWEFTSDLSLSVSGNVTTNSTIARGGGWSDTAPNCAFTDDGRKFVIPTDPSNTVGLRVALRAQPEIIAPNDLDTALLVGSNATFEFTLNRTGSSNLWSVKGDLPPGMSHPFLMNGNSGQGIVLDRSSFVLSGIPTTPGVYLFTIQVETDGYLVEKEVALEVVANGLVDSDGDGVNDYREYRDGTNPNDPTSFNNLSKGLIAYLPLDGTVIDESGYKVPASNSGGIAAVGVQGAINSCMRYGGGHSSTINLDYKNTDALTVSVWLQTSRDHHSYPVFNDSGWAGFGIGWTTAYASGGPGFFAGIGGGVNGWQFVTDVVAGQPNPLITPFGQWVHIVGTVGSDRVLRYYINGSLYASGLMAGRLAWRAGTPTVVKFGQSNDTNPAEIGRADELRIYNRALSAAEVAQLYSKESGEPNMVTVQGGTLPASSGLGNQTVGTFQIGKYETTWEEWQTVRTYAIANGYDLTGVGNGTASTHPVQMVSWYEVVKWSNAKSQMKGMTPVYTVNGTTYKTGETVPTVNASANGYRLPSEKEWEWAARGGVNSQGYAYSGSNDANVVAWTYENSSSGTKAVGTKAANELGVYDMSGNVWEWCWDVYDPSININRRHFRGGGWFNYANLGAVAYRHNTLGSSPVARYSYFGFRLARSPVFTGIVTTFAGTGVAGGVNGNATASSFDRPAGLAFDAVGNIYIGEYGGHRIRKITPAGVVSTFAGSGNPGATDGTGVAATFNQPEGIVVDSSGNLYVADTNNNKIRKITASGVVTTLAGSGTIGAADGTGASATFNRPFDLALDAAGNVYVGDCNNNKIRKITPAGVVTTLAGSGSPGSTDATGSAASFNGTRGLVVDSSGNVYVADVLSHKIRKITPSGVVSSFAGSGTRGSVDGVGTAATFNEPSALTLDSAGNLYVGETVGHKIRKITPAGEVTTLAGSGATGSINGTGSAASFNGPYALDVDSSGTLYVSDTENHLIRKIVIQEK